MVSVGFIAVFVLFVWMSMEIYADTAKYVNKWQPTYMPKWLSTTIKVTIKVLVFSFLVLGTVLALMAIFGDSVKRDDKKS